MTQASHSILPSLIGAIGQTNFPAVAADEFARFLGFDLSAIIVHHRSARPAVLFDNFDRASCREGIENYVAFTHRINPMLARGPAAGVCRARDFSGALRSVEDEHIVMADEEELGFRTVGWPRRMEEVGLYLEASGGIVELSFYRERGRCSLSTSKLRALSELSAPVAAAFDKHASLESHDVPAASALSPREQEICALLLTGCSSHAIALRLGISRHTVKDHRKAIFRKLRVGSLAELFALQARRGR